MGQKILKYKKSFLIICLIILLFAIAGVCASDLNETVKANEEPGADLIKNHDDHASSIEDTVGVNEIAGDNVVGVEDNPTIYTGTFEELTGLIENTTEGTTLELNKDYKYANGSTEGIKINKPITIDGKGHTLDGNQISRVFNVEGNVTLRNINFANCAAEIGGAVKWHGEKGFVSNCSFVNCSTAKGGGGAIWGTIVFNCSFVNCSTSLIDPMFSTGGGAVSDSVVSNCTFIHCYSYYGGAVSDSVVSNSTFADCSASVGGAIWRSTVSNCSFVNCSATVGGAFCLGNRNASIFNCNFSHCSATVGGAIMWNVDYGTIFNCSFANCSAVNGGAVCWDVEYSQVLSSHEGIVLNCSFFNCTACENGGAIEWNGKNASVFNSSFMNCSARYGGAIYNGMAENCTFDYNAAVDGGATYETIANNCNFTKNTVTGYGGAMFKGTAHNCVFKDNHAGIDGNDTYDPATAKSILIVYNFTSAFNSGDKLLFNFTNASGTPVGDANITIRVYKNNTSVGTYYALSGEGWIVNLGAGSYVAVCSVENQTYNADSANATLTISKIDSTLTVNDITSDYGASATTTLSYTGATGVVAIVNSDKAVVDVKGNAVTVFGLDAGTYILSVTTIADADHNNVTKNATLTVRKLKTQMTANAVTTTYNINRDLVITLKDTRGNPLSGVEVIVNLNGVEKHTTNNDGQFKVSTKGLAPKSYTAQITFNGNNNYIKSSKSVKVTVKRATPKLAAKLKTFKKSVKVKMYCVTLKNNQNKVMKNVKVTLKIKGKKAITVKTNNKGVATFKIKNLKKKGTFKSTVTYKGDKYYNKVSKTVNIKIK